MEREEVVFTLKSVWQTAQARRCVTQITSASQFTSARTTASATREKSASSLSLAKRLASPPSSIPQSNVGAASIAKRWEGVNLCARKIRGGGAVSGLVFAWQLVRSMSSATRNTGDWSWKKAHKGLVCVCVGLCVCLGGGSCLGSLGVLSATSFDPATVPAV